MAGCARSGGFLDALVFIALTASTYGLLLYLKWCKRRRR
jgi:hypothetical protein